ncbi:MAG: hypothetical protein K2J07_00740 [Muribaculaceae bacterium]|nr:hypothetical protein [Muribaculaceae bacterium]MDE6831247.1 hypothetical protein [Muribaculaceae bacterium]
MKRYFLLILILLSVLSLPGQTPADGSINGKTDFESGGTQITLVSKSSDYVCLPAVNRTRKGIGLSKRAGFNFGIGYEMQKFKWEYRYYSGTENCGAVTLKIGFDF